ncbi:DUF932 domain-containing protein [Galbibacter marinus]|nr:DUF932 domain-containing protein [Galbibacter marinus]
MYLDKLQQDEVFVASAVRPLRELTQMEPRKGLENVIVSNGKIVNIVSKSYGHIPNELFFAKAEQMLIDAGLTYYRQTINRSDRSFSMDFILSDSTQFSVGNKADTILPMLRFTNSYDGSERTSGHFGFYRMVCSNGLHVVQSEIAFSIKHSTHGVHLIMPELEGFFRRFLDNEFYSISDSFGITETDNEMGNMVETAFFLQWMHRENLDLKYARWKMGRSEGEVDIVLLDNKLFQPQWCVEIKWSNRYFEKPQELKSLIYFCNQNNFSASLVTTIDILDNKTIEDINLTYVPAAVYAYNIGVNTLELKSNW